MKFLITGNFFTKEIQSSTLDQKPNTLESVKSGLLIRKLGNPGTQLIGFCDTLKVFGKVNMTLFTQRKWDRSSLGSIPKYTVFTRDRFQIGPHSFLGSIEKKANAYCLCHQLVCRQIEKKMTSNLKSWQTKCLFGEMKKRPSS